MPHSPGRRLFFHAADVLTRAGGKKGCDESCKIRHSLIFYLSESTEVHPYALSLSFGSAAGA